MAKRKICVVTGTRAEYGLFYWLMREIQKNDSLELQVVATAMHLSPEFGLTYKTIEADGFVIDDQVEMLLSGDSPSAVTKSIGLGTIGFADVFRRLKPDLLLLLGDRFEALAAAQAAMIARIPIAHLHGGEATEGLIDEAIRHSITKMSHLHFVSCEIYRQRVIQLGEHPDRVFNFGAPGIENIKKQKYLSKQQLSEALGFELGDMNFIITYHPVTLSGQPPSLAMRELLEALEHFPEAKLIITYPNADTSGRELIPLIEEFAARHPERTFATASLGQQRYLSALKYCSLVLGNSSSGIIEAPSFSIPTINIGNRQQGRAQAKSMIQCNENKESIIKAIEKGLSPAFLASIENLENPYGNGNTSVPIVQKLREVDLEHILIKPFYDIVQTT